MEKPPDSKSKGDVAREIGRAIISLIPAAGGPLQVAFENLFTSPLERRKRGLAWRIAHLMRFGRTCPDLDAALFFDRDEIEAAYLLREKTPPAQPCLNDVLRQIARVGGFLARKSDGEPGVKTIWHGLKDVHVAVKTMRLLRQRGQPGTGV